MRVAGSTVALVCGIVVLIGVFLPWASGFVLWPSTAWLSGWDGIKDYGLNNATEACLVLIGSILMIGCALPAVIVSLASKKAQGAVLALGIVASVGAALAIGGALWALVPVVSEGLVEFLNYGLYISLATAVLGLMFGVVTSATARSSTS